MRSVCCHYGAGIVGGKESFGCRQEPNVNPNSTTLKRAAIKLRIDHWRWSGYSFFIYGHMRTPRLATTMVIRFKTPPLSMFATHEAVPISPNYLIFKIQPEEGITLQGCAKITGPTVRINSETDNRQPTTGYERLLSNCMVGDAICSIDLTWSKRPRRFSKPGTIIRTLISKLCAGTWGKLFLYSKTLVNVSNLCGLTRETIEQARICPAVGLRESTFSLLYWGACA